MVQKTRKNGTALKKAQSDPMARKRCEILFADVVIGYLVLMSVPYVTLTLLASLLIIGCAALQTSTPLA